MSRDVIAHMTIRLAVGDFLWVVHCDHAPILHRYGASNVGCTDVDAGRKMEEGKEKEEGGGEGKERESKKGKERKREKEKEE